jgi:putative DNA primase/helicase
MNKNCLEACMDGTATLSSETLPQKPCAPRPLLKNIPAYLCERPQWVVWEYEQRGGKPTKVPYNARTGFKAKSTEPRTWSAFQKAVDAFNRGGWDGIGFVLDGQAGIDVDKGFDPATGQLKIWAQAIIDAVPTYWEISPSGKGAKGIALASWSSKGRRRGYEDGEVEMYCRARFFAITGRRLEGTSANVESCQPQVDRLYEKLFPVQSKAASISKPQLLGPADASDQRIIDKVIGKSKFARLWSGDIGGYRSASEADLALLNQIAFYVGPDPVRIDNIFRQSGLCRDKWTERADYRDSTITRALSNKTEFYRWRSAMMTPARAAASSNGTGKRVEWQPPHLTQQVNAERLVEVIDGNARFNKSRGEWMWFDGRRFDIDDSGRVARAAKRVARQTWGFVRSGLAGIERRTAFKHATDSEKAVGIAAMMTLAETESGIPICETDVDTDHYLFNCLNGTIDLRTCALRPHRREDLITKLASVAYDPNAPRPVFEAFLHRIMAGNATMIAYLRRLLGRCLSGDISEQEVYFCIGEGANGKSVLIDTVLGILGDYGDTAPESLLTVRSHDEHATEIAALCGMRLVVASETEEGARLKVQRVKRMTGDKKLRGRFMRRDFFTFNRTHKLIIVSNNKPVIRETKHAIWRRIRLVPFSVVIPDDEQDGELTEKLKHEWPGILAWLVEGYRDWKKGGMRTPKEVLVATRNYRSEQDPLADYIADRCVIGASTVRVSRNAVFTDYMSWCVDTGENYPLTRNALFEGIRGTKGVQEGQWRVTGQTAPVRGFCGIGLAHTAGVCVAESGGDD